MRGDTIRLEKTEITDAKASREKEETHKKKSSCSLVRLRAHLLALDWNMFATKNNSTQNIQKLLTDWLEVKMMWEQAEREGPLLHRQHHSIHEDTNTQLHTVSLVCALALIITSAAIPPPC